MMKISQSTPQGAAVGAASRLRRGMAAKIGAIAVAMTSASAAAAGLRSLVPSSGFVQAGVAKEAQMLIAGVTWDWNWRKEFSFGYVSGYWDASLGRWNSDIGADRGGSAWVTQIGLTPVLRLHPRRWNGRWFLEAGIGANFLLPIYRSRTKRFSTAFNFGDHLAIGRQFGEGAEHEVTLRLQHFSNAGIKHPNPGEDFVQIRYSSRF